MSCIYLDTLNPWFTFAQVYLLIDFPIVLLPNYQLAERPLLPQAPSSTSPGWLFHHRTDCFTTGLTVSPQDWLFHHGTDCLTAGVAVSLAHCFICWLSLWFTVSLFVCLTGWLSHCFVRLTLVVTWIQAFQNKINICLHRKLLSWI